MHKFKLGKFNMYINESAIKIKVDEPEYIVFIKGYNHKGEEDCMSIDFSNETELRAYLEIVGYAWGNYQYLNIRDRMQDSLYVEFSFTWPTLELEKSILDIDNASDPDPLVITDTIKEVMTGIKQNYTNQKFKEFLLKEIRRMYE